MKAEIGDVKYRLKVSGDNCNEGNVLCWLNSKDICIDKQREKDSIDDHEDSVD